VQHVSEQSHAMAGAVIAMSAAQAAALGQACVEITIKLADSAEISHHDLSTKVEQTKIALLQLCNEDAGAIAKFVALRESGSLLTGERLLCQIPFNTAQHAVEAALLLQSFRKSVNERVRDDLEMSICLLTGTAQAAVLLLDSNLRIWPEQALLSEFEPVLEALQEGINSLSPVTRIRERD
ncbi:MAG: cyclodeaminase/cyclohydrolase family protein, partial [Candidatus Promineifilaceae bacterium]|nr:cyclodeaminase/cyclohydrolase family protein [Candidatus Promineifilaceae bacterium]